MSPLPVDDNEQDDSDSVADYSVAGTVSSYGDNKATFIPAVQFTETGKGISDSMTPLMRAATLEDPSTLLQLIRDKDAVATLFVKDAKGRTALDWARLCNNHLTIIALRKAMLANIDEARVEMVRAPQDVDEKAKYANTVAHMQFTEALKQRNSERCIEIILESKENFTRDDVERLGGGEVYFLDTGNHVGFTPLMLAATYNMPELVALLLDMDVELEQTNKYGYTALSCACAGGHADIVRTLIFTGANLHHKTNEGRTGLHLACMYLKARVISVLLDFLFERFSTYRLKHPKFGFDSTRWTRYATMMEGYMDIKDLSGKTAWQLLPLDTMHGASLGTRLGAGLGTAAMLLPPDSLIKREKQAEDITANLTDEGSENDSEANMEKDDDGDRDGEKSEGRDSSRNSKKHDGDDDEERKLSPNKRLEEVPPPLPRVDARSVETITTYAKQQTEHKAVVEKLRQEEAIEPATNDDDDKNANPTDVPRAVSAGSLARPGGPLPYPRIPKAASAAEVVAKLMSESEIGGTVDPHDGGNEFIPPSAVSSISVLDKILVPPSPGLEDEGDLEDGISGSLTARSAQSGSTLSLSTMPNFSHDTDNFIAEHPNLADSHSVLTASALEEEVRVILLLSQQARDRIEGWRMAALAEDIVDQKVPCWLGCGFTEAVEGIATHARDLCPFRGKQCVGCRQIFKYIELAKHRDKECPKRVVGCPNAYEGCAEMPTFDFLYQHANLRCAYRKVPCRLNCGGNVAYCKRDDHEETHCNRRGLTCDQCKLVVPALTFGKHLRDECVERLVPCTVSCRCKFKAKDVKRHEEEECVQECKWECGRRIGPAELRGMHEFIGCPRRPVTCKFKCGLGGLTAEFLKEHEKYQCPERLQRCPNGCGDRVKRKDLSMHLDSWHGSCPERLVRCPSDYVGWRVFKVDNICPQVTPASIAMTVVDDNFGNDEPATESKAEGSFSSSAPNQSLVKSRLVSLLSKHKDKNQDPEKDFLDGCSNVGIIIKYSRVSFPPDHPQARPNARHFEASDQLLIKFPDRHEILDFWALRATTRLILLKKVQGDSVFSAHKATKFSCKWVACTALEHHLAYDCVRRSVWVGDKSTINASTSSDLNKGGGASEGRNSKFIGQREEFRSSVNLAERRNDFDEFILAPPTTVTCEFCANDFPPGNLSEHQRTACGGVSVRCKLGCGKRMPRSLLDDHANNQCPKRPLACPQCGDKGMWVDEIEMHLAQECRARPVICRFKCGTKGLTAETEPPHCLNDCEYRLMNCSCGQVLQVRDHGDHMISDCPDKPTLCPQGCGATIGRNFVNFHIEFQCSKKGIFFSRQMFCPIGCGARMAKKDILFHVTYICQRRLSDCPLGCGQTIQFEKLRVHLYFCPRRAICCEPGMKYCNKLLYKWFYDDGGVGQNKSGSSTEEEAASVVELAEEGVRGLLDEHDDEAEGQEELVYFLQQGDEDGQRDVDYSTIANSLESVDDQPPLQVISRGSTRGGAPFTADDALVPFKKPGTARPQTGASRPSTSRMLGINPDTLTEKASITVVGNRMFLKSRLRLRGCKHHGATALMAACRLNELPLGTFLVKTIEGMDLEMESVAGETALTLACRLGKLDFVELLVQNGADVNYETSLGKTALIEAVRASVENVPVVDFLVAAGALVAYKTKKHGRSAMEWARLLKLAAVARLLELGEIVQRQTTLLFNAIGCGETAKVRELVGDGEFFHANNEKVLYDKMEHEVGITRKAHMDAGELRRNMKDLSSEVEGNRTAMFAAEADYHQAKHTMDDVFIKQDKLTLALSKLFVTYERIADTLLRSDLEELGRLRKPDVAVRGAVFCYGILMGHIDREKYVTNDFSFETAKKWWPHCAETLRDSKEAMKRIRAFSLDKLMAALARPLLDRARSMYRDLSLAVATASREAAEATRASTSRAGSRSDRGGSRGGSRRAASPQRNLSDDDGSAPVAVIPWGKRSTTPGTVTTSDLKFKAPEFEAAASPERLKSLLFSNTDDLQGLRPRTTGREFKSTDKPGSAEDVANKKACRAAKKAARLRREELELELDGGDSDSGSEGIPDADWDSEAEDAGGGEWVKGEWVPIVKKKEKWWIQKPKKGSKEEELLLQQQAEEEELERQKAMKRREVEEKFGDHTLTSKNKSSSTSATTAAAAASKKPSQEARSGKPLSRGVARAITVDLTNSSGSHVRPPSGHSLSKPDLLELADPPSSPQGQLMPQKSESDDPFPSRPTTRAERQREAAARAQEADNDAEREVVEQAYRTAMADSSSAQFVRCILVLLKAANQLSEDKATMQALKDSVVSVGQDFDEQRRRHQAAQVAFLGSQSRRLMTEKNLIDMIRYARFTLRRAKRFREKLRVARLLNKVTTSGHTAMSYAASLGNLEALELLLKHGGSPGFNSQLLHLTASYIQLSYRLYRFVTEARREGIDAAQDKFRALKKESKRKLAEAKNSDVAIDAADDDDDRSTQSDTSETTQSHPRRTESVKTDQNVVAGEFTAMTSDQAVEKMFAMKEHRSYILNKIRFFRSRMRFPVAEAAYAGKWEIIQRMVERGLFHFNFSATWIHPSPPPPYVRHYFRTDAKPEKLDMLKLVAMGMNDISAGAYVEGQGWVSPDDPREHFGLAQEYLQSLSNRLKKQREEWHKERYRIHCLALERIKSRKAIPEFCRAVVAQDWRACIFYASNAGVSIDHETDYGVTCLIAASEEDVGRLNYAPMLNDDGTPCLAVEYLLDRTSYRAAVNLELSDKCAHTALIRASALGRAAVVAALADRGAEINRLNRLGKLALHYAAEAGNYDTVRVLLERGSDLSILTPEGKSAYDIAEEYGFLNVMKAISRYGNGFLGPVRASRGRVEELMRCPLGCGADMESWDVPDHLKVCLLRVVVCPLDCGERLIMAKELNEHIKDACARRKVECDWCRDPVEFRDVIPHKDNDCVHRYVPCNLGCGQNKKVYEMKKHLKFCPWRFVPCQLQCGLELRVCEMSTHVKTACAYRKLPCPLKCGAFVTYKLMALHVRDTCPLRPCNCKFCMAPLQFRELEVHQRSCHVREEPCPANCGEMVCITDTKVHLVESCSHRFVPCPLKCNQKIRLCDTTVHSERICDMRLVPCPLKCLVNEAAPVLEQEVCKITARLLDLHTTLECPERLVHCLNCKGGVKSKESKRHKETTCPMRLVPCRNPGCSKEMHLGDREEHERKTCKFKLVVCPQGCGELVAAIYTGRHMMLACTWRYSNCPLGCGANMRHRMLREHMESECARRFATGSYGVGEKKRAVSPTPNSPPLSPSARRSKSPTFER